MFVRYPPKFVSYFSAAQGIGQWLWASPRKPPKLITVNHATGDLLNQEVVDFTDRLVTNAIDVRPLNIFTRY
jgi:hypothetical protein